MAKERFPIHRTRIGKDIVAEFAVPPTERLRKKRRVAIVAKGAPTMPSGSSLLEFLARQGFYAVAPRYRGTWESSGTFLKSEPTDDLRATLEAVQGPLVSLYEEREYEMPHNAQVYLFVASFSGPAGMFLARDPQVARVFAYAPVVDWRERTERESINHFATMIKRIYGEGYRIDPKGAEKLERGTFYNPATAPERIEGAKIRVFHAKDDDIVAYAPVARFARDRKMALTTFARGGHGGVSSFMDERVWRHIQKDLGIK